MNKVIKLETVVKFISEDLGESVKVVSVPFENDFLKVIVKDNINPLNAYFDDEDGLVILDSLNKDIVEETYCILYPDDFIDIDTISLDGALNGCLVLTNLEPFTETELTKMSVSA